MRAGLALALAIAAGLGFWAGERHGRGDRLSAQENRGSAAHEAPRARTATDPVPSGLPPNVRSPLVVPVAALPPLDMPVMQILDDLERRAHAGDARAACRVAFELERCRGLRAAQASMATFRDLAERPGVGPVLAKRYNAMADREQARYLEGRRLCEGVPQREADDSWRYLLQAARSGHVPSMARFASRRAFRDADPVAALDGLIAYRNEGPAFLQRAAQAGNAEAYEQLAFAYVTGMDLGLGVPRDAVRGVAYYTALMRVASAEEARRVQRAIDYAVQDQHLGGEEVARARALAQPLAAALLRGHEPGSVDLGPAGAGRETGAECER